jgi:hypothetical protein
MTAITTFSPHRTDTTVAVSKHAAKYTGALHFLGFSAVKCLGALAVFCAIGPAWSATAPALGTNATHAVVASTLTDVAPSTLTGDGCYTTLTGAPVITGTVTIPCAPQRGLDQNSALATINGQACTSLGGAAVVLNTTDVGSGPGVFPPGCYSSGGAMSIAAGTVTLSGPGVYVFRPGGTLTTANNTNVAVTGGACESDVFWAPTGPTTLGANASFRGTIFDGIANAVSVGTTTAIVGRIISFGGAITLNTDTIAKPTCVTNFGAGVPTLSEWALITFALLIVGVALYTPRRRPV